MSYGMRERAAGKTMGNYAAATQEMLTAGFAVVGKGGTVHPSTARSMVKMGVARYIEVDGLAAIELVPANERYR